MTRISSIDAEKLSSGDQWSPEDNFSASNQIIHEFSRYYINLNRK